MRTDTRLPTIAAIFLCGAAFFLSSLGSRDLWQPLETRYATVAREMVETGDYLLPHENGRPYRDKPPLFFWLAALLRKAGCGAQGVRVLSALAAAGTLAVTAALAGLWFSRRAAILGAAILATIPEFAWVGQFGELDVPLTFLTTLAVYGWFAGGRRVALFYLGVGLGVMVKGPAAVLVPVLAIVAGRLARVPPASPRAPLHLAWGPAVALAPAALWLALAVASAGSAYAHELVVHHILGRVVDSWQHRQPLWFYFDEGPANFLPWLLPAVPAAVRAWRHRRDEPAHAALLLWFGLGLLSFSLFSGKRIAYILPLAPPLALVTARGIEALLLEAARPERNTAALLRIVHTVLAAAGAGFLAFGLGGGVFMLKLRATTYKTDALLPIARLPGGAVLAAGGLLVLGISLFGGLQARRHRHLLSVASVVAATAAGFLVVHATFVPRADTYMSPRAVTAHMDRLLPPGAGEVGIYPHAFSGGFNIYSQRLYLKRLPTAQEALTFLASPERRLVVSTRDAFAAPDADGRTLAGSLPAPVRVVEAGRVGRSEMIFLANFEP